mmetsp:Transcript_647/g.1506  ORF Transcript_647/g.1506 Transcript_647/m.1506 type:complete len:237 (+) Transcript_647:933-1643(+)
MSGVHLLAENLSKEASELVVGVHRLFGLEFIPVEELIEWSFSFHGTFLFCTFSYGFISGLFCSPFVGFRVRIKLSLGSFVLMSECEFFSSTKAVVEHLMHSNQHVQIACAEKESRLARMSANRGDNFVHLPSIQREPNRMSYSLSLLSLFLHWFYSLLVNIRSSIVFLHCSPVLQGFCFDLLWYKFFSSASRDVLGLCFDLFPITYVRITRRVEEMVDEIRPEGQTGIGVVLRMTL